MDETPPESPLRDGAIELLVQLYKKVRDAHSGSDSELYNKLKDAHDGLDNDVPNVDLMDENNNHRLGTNPRGTYGDEVDSRYVLSVVTFNVNATSQTYDLEKSASLQASVRS